MSPPGPGRAERVAIVRDFLVRCRAWGSDREIPATLARLAAEPSPREAARLHQWTTWVAFVDHALAELDDGTLDSWFPADSASEPRAPGDPDGPAR